MEKGGLNFHVYNTSIMVWYYIRKATQIANLQDHSVPMLSAQKRDFEVKNKGKNKWYIPNMEKLLGIVNILSLHDLNKRLKNLLYFDLIVCHVRINIDDNVLG